MKSTMSHFVRSRSGSPLGEIRWSVTLGPYVIAEGKEITHIQHFQQFSLTFREIETIPQGLESRDNQSLDNEKNCNIHKFIIYRNQIKSKDCKVIS
jgi:hypothetical protein